jgi:hypothetical protein
MKVKLTRRLGLNKAGTRLDYTDSEADWLITRGYAVRLPDAPPPPRVPATPAAPPAAPVVPPTEGAGVAEPGTSSETTTTPPEQVPAPAHDDPTPPPRSGQGSGRPAWAEHATRLGVTVADAADRGDIIAAVKAAGHPID